MVNTTQMLGLQAVARILGVSRKTAAKLAAAGDIPGAVRLGSRMRFSLPVIEAFLKNPRMPIVL